MDLLYGNVINHVERNKILCKNTITIIKSDSYSMKKKLLSLIFVRLESLKDQFNSSSRLNLLHSIHQATTTPTTTIHQ